MLHRDGSVCRMDKDTEEVQNMDTIDNIIYISSNNRSQIYFLSANGDVYLSKYSGCTKLNVSNIIEISSNFDNMILCLDVHGDVYSIYYDNIVKKYDIKDVVQIECGGNHNMFLTSDGTVYGCGSNEYNQLLDTDISIYDDPVVIANDARYIAVGEYSSFYIDKNNKLHIIGTIEHLQCDIDVTDVIAIYPCEDYTLFLKSDRTVYVIGTNDGEFTGMRSKISKLQKIKYPISAVIQVSVFARSIVYLTDDIKKIYVTGIIFE